ncbi:uncharacterized protein LOC108844454 [Raphanus sativus]|uniref:Uncharacterized protein LOC108844454 n=1 Tax=Raphanus sativus TaxID=3726 RepID=A0A6J0ML46_RAPSA|nr:uncharacterized protein LOC108844454 [Raphanus sativus]
MTEDSGELAAPPPPGEIRTALSDLSNLQKKRGISSMISSDSSLKKSGDGSGSRVEFSKRLCVVVDDLVKQNESSSDSKCSSEDKQSRDAMVEVSRPLKEKEIYFEPGDRDGARELNTDEGLALSVLSSSSNSDDAEIGRKELGRCQNVRSFEMSRCSNVVNKEEEEEENVNDDDLIKSCSCSFCLKAAYIWSDLHYQDIKGRLSALKKSQKVASSLIQRNDNREKPHALVNSVASAKLASDLTAQWRSLFLSMGDILAHESNHLQDSFMTMKDLREDCKIDLERATKTPQHNT